MAKRAAKTDRHKTPVLPAAGGGFVIHGRGKADPQVLRDLRPAVKRAEKTAADLRKLIADNT